MNRSWKHWLLASGLTAALCGSALGASANLFQAAGDSLLVQSLYQSPKRLANHVAASGAISLNSDFESGKGDKWFIEQQRYGGDLVQAGLERDNEALLQEGLKVLDWGFAKEGSDGDFPGTGDSNHSVSLFLEASSRAALLLKQSGDPKYQSIVADDTPKIHRMAQWLTRPEGEEWLIKKQHQYTHKYWVWAAAVGQAAELTGDSDLADKAKHYAEIGLGKQTSDGVNPEKDGYDVSYQGLGILLACRYYLVCHDTKLKSRIKSMIERGLAWETSEVDEQGHVYLDSSTRTGVEAGRSGKTKGVDYVALVQAYVIGAQITGKSELHTVAKKIVTQKGWGGEKDQQALLP